MLDRLEDLRKWAIRKLGGVPAKRNSKLVSFAELELSKLPEKNEEIQKILNDDVVDIVSVVAEQQHSETSRFFVSNALYLILNNKILTPLTGNQDEWEILDTDDDNPLYAQNKRKTSVFMHKDGSCSDYDGIVYLRPDEEGGYTAVSNSDSCIDVEFPYMPNRKLVYLDENGHELGHKFEDD